MSGTTSVLEFTGPRGGKARVFFENGHIRHATAPGKEGVEAFNEIVNWKGGMISEVAGAGESPRTIDLDWQVLLLEAVRKIDESRSARLASEESAGSGVPTKRRIVVIDDSPMLLNFVKDTLAEADYDVVAAGTAEEGLRAAAAEVPDLILLDYVLPDMKGDEVLRRLLDDSATAKVPVVYMSGFGADLPSEASANSNVVGSLNKPFTSELLLKTVDTYMPKETVEPKAASAAAQPAESGWARPENTEAAAEGSAEFSTADAPALEGSAVTMQTAPDAESGTLEAAAGGESDAWWSAPARVAAPWPETTGAGPAGAGTGSQIETQPAFGTTATAESFGDTGGAYFCGDTSFFSLNWALHTIAKQKLTGTLRAFWTSAPVELLARDGQILLATIRDPELYCPEAPITLVNIDEERTIEARRQQRETGRPLFITLAQEGLILREPAMQLVQHYGQKLFAQLWTAPRVRIMFDQSAQLPDYAQDVPPEEDIDHWALSTLRFIQFTELGTRADYDPASIPAYTRDGFERVQRLRLTVAEAQFASQFNGVRSIAQIAKNLRLDQKFARLTLFRFLALEIVECWPPAAVGPKSEKRGVFGRMFGD
ncbi:MAG: response regulator [Chthoniobacterales bacterium]